MKQALCCQSCCESFSTDFSRWDGRVCSQRCWDYLQLVRAYATVGAVTAPSFDYFETEQDKLDKKDTNVRSDAG